MLRVSWTGPVVGFDQGVIVGWVWMLIDVVGVEIWIGLVFEFEFGVVMGEGILRWSF